MVFVGLSSRRWRVGIWLLCLGLPLQFGDALAGRKHGQCHGLRPQIMKSSGASFIELPA